MALCNALAWWTFQSTLPVRGATQKVTQKDTPQAISIHAPREGERPRKVIDSALDQLFQSTLPVRGATVVLAVGVHLM